MAKGRIRGALGSAGKFVGGNLAVMAMFSLLGPYIDQLVNGSPEGGGMPEGGEDMGGGLPPDLLDALMAGQSGGGMGDGGVSGVERMLRAREMQNQLAGSGGAAYGSSFAMPERTISPELLSLTESYRDQIAGLSQQTPRGFAQLMAERGYY